MSGDPAAAARARDYLSLSAQDFVQRHPQASAALTTESALRSAIQDAAPIRPAVERLLQQQLRQSIAATLARGQIPAATPAAIAQVTFQTAYSSLEHVAGLRALRRDPELQLSDSHRELLVDAANTLRLRGVDVPISEQRAAQIAVHLAAVDSNNSANPFTHDALRQAYNDNRPGMQPDVAPGRDRGR